MNKSLSDLDISQALDNQTKVIQYTDLADFNNIEQALNPYDNIVILYPSEDGGPGHWTCVLYTQDDNGEKIIEFFDPYGISVDKEFDYTKKLNYPNYLSYLLYKTPYKISYNDNKMQKFSNNINTCGRHVINRIRNNILSLKQYNRLYGNAKGVSSDKLVTILTS